jgi:hypothetical protein
LSVKQRVVIARSASDEAIQNLRRSWFLDCFAALAMTENTAPHSRGADCARVLGIAALEESKRAQGTPGDGLTHGPPATKKAGGSHHRFSQINRHSLRNGFAAYSALFPVSMTL